VVTSSIVGTARRGARRLDFEAVAKLKTRSRCWGICPSWPAVSERIHVELKKPRHLRDANIRGPAGNGCMTRTTIDHYESTKVPCRISQFRPAN